MNNTGSFKESKGSDDGQLGIDNWSDLTDIVSKFPNLPIPRQEL